MSQSPSPELRQAILAALDLDLSRPKLSMPYRIGLMLVALVMVLLPLIYLAIVAGAAYGVYWHATENLVIFDEVKRGRNAVFAYVTPLVIGVILVFFMLKPLLAPRGKRPPKFEADPEEHPFLHQFVGALTAAVGAPAPRRILLDCDANASAGFHQGGLGLASSGRELTIGLPLVGGMTIRQLGGVLAHEFGHFSQGMAMRLSFVVMAVNSWFGRVVFQRDAWDEALVKWSHAGGFSWVSGPALLARGCVWLTRRLLYGLMWIGHVVSSNMSRQMEYDADSFEIQLAGSESFAQSMVAVVELGMAQDAAMNNLAETWEQRRLPADLPSLIVSRHGEIDAEGRQRLMQNLENEPASLFASHPRSVDRIRVAQQAAEEGVFAIDAPATVLFDDFAAVCQQVSTMKYSLDLGSRFEQAQLIQIDEYLGDRRQARDEAAADARFFQGSSTVMRALPQPTPTRASLAALRSQLCDDLHKTWESTQQLIETHDDFANNELARAYLAVKQRIDIKDFKLSAATVEAVDAQATELSTRLTAQESTLDALLQVGAQRLAATLQSAADSPSRRECQDLQQQLAPVAACLDPLVRIRTRLTVLSSLFEYEPSESKQDAYQAQINRHARAIHQELQTIEQALDGQAYPFSHAEKDASMLQVALPSMPSANKIDRLWQAAVHANETLSGLYTRMLGRIAFLAEELESEQGLPVLPMPERPQKADEGEVSADAG